MAAAAMATVIEPEHVSRMLVSLPPEARAMGPFGQIRSWAGSGWTTLSQHQRFRRKSKVQRVLLSRFSSARTSSLFGLDEADSSSRSAETRVFLALRRVSATVRHRI